MKDCNHHLKFRTTCAGRTRGFAVIAALIVAVCNPAPRAWAEDGVTNIINGIVVNIPGDAIVGTNGRFNALIVTNAAVLTVSGNSTIGSNSSAGNNLVLVSGPGSVWSNVNNLYVGDQGFANQLTVNSGGSVVSSNGFVGSATSASNNVVFVTGPGSVWSNMENVFVGYGGSGNRLSVTNGGNVVSGAGYIGWGSNANNNTVLVGDSGSRWTNNSKLYVGYDGSSNTLTITNGGQALSAGGYVGLDSSANNNAASVIGTGSVWNSSGDFYVGATGSWNRLIITNGGQVLSVNSYVGFDSNANNNAVSVNGTGSVWNSSGDLTIGYAGSNNSLSITSGGRVVGSSSYVGSLTNASVNNTVLVTDSGSLWTNNGNLYVGDYGSGNSLTISNGAQVVNNTGYIGFDGQATNNTVLVTGTGSVWNNTNDLYMGYFGSGGKLIISNGAQVIDVDAHIGGSGSSNVVTVTGGSLWGNGGTLFVGQKGSNNTMFISNGSLVTNYSGWVGFDSNANNNAVFVTGSGSMWSNAHHLGIGMDGSGNRLTISNGGQVLQGYGESYIGNGTNANNNSVLVTGPGSIWSNVSGRELYVGYSGSSNSLTISNGGLVANGDGYVGYDTNANGNWVSVAGAGSVWTNRNLYVGNNGSGNSLTISNSGKVVNSSGYLGVSDSATNNAVWVTGAGSVWSNGGNLYVGYTGSFNQLTITNGGTVFSAGGSIGDQALGNSNAVRVAGAGSVWNNSSDLYVGNGGSFNQLTIANSGTVFNVNGWIGSGVLYSAAANSNTVLVTGAGSVWSNGANLSVGGLMGEGNQLTIANGGTVYSANGYIGVFFFANSNAVLVSGAGSVWNNSSDLYVGLYGSGNQLTIANSGTVFNVNGYVGLRANSNAVLVAGGGSVWSNGANLYVGSRGSFNQLTITNAGAVFSAGGSIGDEAGGNSNSVLVSGAGSVWSNSSDLYVGNNGSFNQLTISNGGQVVNSNGFVGFDAGASNNAALVTGSGSVWSNNGNLHVGESGSGNSLTVSNGAQVISANGYVGFGNNATNNAALVAGAGSLWTNSADLFIGEMGSSNRLTVRDGGLLVNNNGYVGFETNAYGNAVWVAGTGSVWRSSGKLYVGAAGSSNTMMVTLGGRVISGEGVIGYAATASSNAVEVSGAGSLWNNAGGFSVGYTGSFNQLVIGGGGQVLSSSGAVGFVGSDNSVVVGGAGSVWSNSGRLALGVLGGSAMNSLTVTNGGAVFSAGATIGMLGSANSVLIGGTGSVWNNSGNDILVGSAGISNKLTVTNGGQVLSCTGYIGWDGAATNNSALVSGAGALWNNSDSLYVGYTGSFNQLTVNDSGTVVATNVVLGYSQFATGNVITVAGGNLFATNAVINGALDVRNGTLTFSGGTIVADHFYVTNNVVGATNSMFDFNYGTLTTKGDSQIVTPAGNNAVLGAAAGQTATWNILGGSNLVTQVGGAGNMILGNVVGATGAVTVFGGTLDLNNGQVTIGNSSSGNSLIVTNGSRLLSNAGRIGNNAGANDNTVLVTGAGSIWDNTNDLYVGNFGSGNSLTISSGGTVAATNVVAGFDPTSVNNQMILLTGGHLNATNAAAGGALDVRNGSLTLNGGNITANYFYATNNTVIANKSVFNFNDGTLNTLNGSQIVVPSASNLVIGANAGQTATWNILGGTNLVAEVPGNTSTTMLGGVSGAIGIVKVSGAGTVWSNTTDLVVGEASSFNQMIITNGAQVMSVNGFIGNTANANSNVVVVTGSNSLWLTSGNLLVGAMGVSNQLIVGSGATVDVRGKFTVGPGGQFLNSGNLLSAATEIGTGGELIVTAAGALGTGAVVNSGTLIFNPAGVVTVNNAISGGGSLQENGPGMLVLTSSNAYTGGTLITGGIVSLKSTYALGFGPVTLTGGLLKADPLLMKFGTYTQLGGTLQLAVGGTKAAGVDYDQVNVTGTVTIGGGTLKVVPFGSYQPKSGDAVPLMVAGGGFGGTTYPVFDDSAFRTNTLTPVSSLLLTNLIYTPTALTLKWSQLPFLTYALTPNQQAVARHLDAPGVVNHPRMKEAIDYLDYLPGGVAQLPMALDLISPHQLISMFTLGFAGAEVQGYNLLGRLRDIRDGSAGFSANGLSFYDPTGTVDGRMGFYDPVGSGGPGPLTHLASDDSGEGQRVFKNKPMFRPLKDNPWGVFVSGAGQFIGVQGNRNANGYNVASGGLTVGADYRLMDGTLYPFDQLVIGVALGYVNSSADIGGGGRIDVNGAQGNVYTAWFREGFHVEGMLGGGCDVYDTRRQALKGTASGNSNGSHLQGLLGTGYDWQSGPWTFGPQVSAQYTRMDIEGFDERDSLLPLHIESQGANSLHSQMGAHLTYRAVAGTVVLTPEVRAGWRHEYMNPDIALDSRFANGVGGVFSVKGPALGKDSAVLGLGLSAQWTDDLTTFVNYDTELGRANYQLHYLNAGVRISL